MPLQWATDSYYNNYYAKDPKLYEGIQPAAALATRTLGNGAHFGSRPSREEPRAKRARASPPTGQPQPNRGQASQLAANRGEAAQLSAPSSIKEIKAALDALGLDYTGLTEKSELVSLLQQHQPP